ncbi:ABC-type transport auxiliary lipoprotein family protein [Ancylobacter sp. A5.8]|uniref:ABC-type transport auxiliary lipoprotein family protein n=1 Tax=Ancylobacter gelatini TaxID=2919920 RepID=UPI001F4E99F0|nr:ABC-type transport auxiliary lipoprotein family protein [Ancylobacter gelatini]
MNSNKACRRAAGIGLTVGLALLGGGCASVLGSKPVPTFDLTAPTDFRAPRAGRGQLVVAAPTALQVLDTQQIVVEPAAGQINYLGGAQWADSLPALFQARLIESFQNGSRGSSVGRASDGIVAEYALLTDIRSFGLQTFQGNEAVVEVFAKIVRASDGRIIGSQLFKARAPASGTAGPEVTRALDEAADTVLVELVDWASRRF